MTGIKKPKSTTEEKNVSEEKVRCDVCGRDMTLPSGQGVWALHIELLYDDGASEETKAALETIMAPYKVGKAYSVCFSCLLRTLGVQPD